MSETAASAADIRPVIATGNPGSWGLGLFVVALCFGGYLLFSALRSGNEAVQAPSTSVGSGDQPARIVAPPPLQLPPDYAYGTVPPRGFQQLPPVLLQREPDTVASRQSTSVAQAPSPTRSAEPFASLNPSQTIAPVQLRPSVVFEDNRQVSAPAVLQAGAVDRVSASRLANPSMTIPQGTVIPAVLETALDSTRPGAVRALVQRDIHSFDGSRVLIHRGSRLYGSYEAGINPGERRALIRWTRLLRPDGVTIALDSAASDPLGRAGVEGDVDSRFFARFGGALLQSVLDIGVGVASSQAGGVIVALPGSAQTISQSAQQQQQARPVLQVPHGTSVSVFVERDLDFSSVDR